MGKERWEQRFHGADDDDDDDRSEVDLHFAY